MSEISGAYKPSLIALHFQPTLRVCLYLQRPGAALGAAEARVSSELRKTGEWRVWHERWPCPQPAPELFLQSQAVGSGPGPPQLGLITAPSSSGGGSARPARHTCPPGALLQPCRAFTPSPQLSAGSRAGPGGGRAQNPHPDSRAPSLASIRPMGPPGSPQAHLSHGSARAARAWYRSPWQPCICRSGF